MKKYGIIGQLRNKLFMITIHLFSLVKAAMSAPCICKLRDGVTKMPPLFRFPIAKGGTKTMYGLLQAFFIERDPHSGTEIGERDTVLSA